MKAFVASHSLLNVHEVASWLLEMNQELLSVGSKRRRTGGSVRGNASSSQADEEQMNRVEEEDEQQDSRQPEDQHIVLNGDVDGHGSVDRRNSQLEQLEENNNSCVIADQESEDQPEEHEPAEDEEDEEHVCDVDEEDEEEMDQDSDDFDQSDDSSREDERRNSRDIPNSNSIMDITLHQKATPFHIKTKVSAVLYVYLPYVTFYFCFLNKCDFFSM